MRVDQALVEQGLANSRTQAQQMIDGGLVYLADPTETPIKKSSQKIIDPTLLRVRESELHKYVSRGGLKLEGALRHTKFDPLGITALDVGISTGGFTDCILKSGAQQVIGIDVGHNQLAAELQNDPRVICLEGINARELSAAHLQTSGDTIAFDLIVVDVSFISLTLILPRLPVLLKAQGKLLALVKPQFEVGQAGLGKGGVVKDSSLFKDVENKIRTTCKEVGFEVEDYFESSIHGGDGNKEFFVFASRI